MPRPKSLCEELSAAGKLIEASLALPGANDAVVNNTGAEEKDNIVHFADQGACQKDLVLP